MYIILDIDGKPSTLPHTKKGINMKNLENGISASLRRRLLAGAAAAAALLVFSA